MCNIPVWDNNTIDADLKLKAQDCLVFHISCVKFGSSGAFQGPCQTMKS